MNLNIIRTLPIIFLVSFCTIVSQLILKKGIMDITSRFSGIIYAPSLLLIQAARSPFVWVSLFLQAISFCIWIIVISKYKLGFAFGISGAFFYLLLPFFSWMVFGERLSLFQWIGLVFITSGIFFMTINK